MAEILLKPCSEQRSTVTHNVIGQSIYPEGIVEDNIRKLGQITDGLECHLVHFSEPVDNNHNHTGTLRLEQVDYEIHGYVQPDALRLAAS